MKCFDYDSHAILSLIKHDFIQENRWSVQPYFDEVDRKCIRIIWHPSTLVYNYLSLRQQKLQQLFGGQIFRLYRMNQDDGTRFDGGGWRQDIYVTCDQGAIIINWIPYRNGGSNNSTSLSASRVNNQIEGLTAQLVHISLRIPYWDGIVRHTQTSHRWQSLKYLAHHHQRINYSSNVLYWKTLSLRCFVSSHRGVYQRNDAGNIIPLRCSEGISPGFYKKHNRGKCRFMIQTPSSASLIGHSFKERTWAQYVRRQKSSWFFALNSQNQVLWGGNVLLDASSRQPVTGDDYIISGHVYESSEMD